MSTQGSDRGFLDSCVWPAVQHGSNFLANESVCCANGRAITLNVKETDVSIWISVVAVYRNKCLRLAHHVANRFAAFANNKANSFARNWNRNLVDVRNVFLFDGSGRGLGGGGLRGGDLRSGRYFGLIIISWVRRS